MIADLGARIAAVAAARPDAAAVIAVDTDRREEVLSWGELAEESGRLAEELRRQGIRSAVEIPAFSTVGTVVPLVAVLRSGLLAVPTDPQTPETDRERRLAVVAAELGRPLPLEEALAGGAAGPVHPAAARGGVALLTGGTTGLPKVIHRPGVPSFDDARGPSAVLRRTGWATGQVHLVVGPLHHAAPLTHLIDGLLSGNTMVLSAAFYPELMLDLVERHRVEWMQLTPTHMRMADAHIRRRPEAVATLRGILHTSAPCPPDTKRAWIEVLGPDRVHEMYAATEGIGVTLCSGTEWLERPGTVGRGFLTRIRIYGDGGELLPPGQTGTVYMRTPPSGGASRPVQLGAAYAGRDGFRTAGDLGRLDEDGYLFLAGRRDDLVIVGGENVYTDDVVFALLAHPEVEDAAVLGVPDPVFGSRLRAWIVTRSSAVPGGDGTGGDTPGGSALGGDAERSAIMRHCMDHLAPAKVPRDLRVVPALPRNRAGKLLRAELERLA